MTRLLVLLATLVLSAAAGAGAAAGEVEPPFFSWDYWLEGGNALRSEVVRNLGLLAAAVIGLVVGSWRAVMGYIQARASQAQAAAATEQARIAEQGLITDRYAKAVEMLSSDKTRARTGAVYALARIAQDSVERDHAPIMAVLSEFVCNPPYTAEALDRAKARREAQEGGEQEADSDGAPEIPPAIQCPDVIAALRSIAQRNAAQKAHETRLGVRVGFVRANLRELNLERAKLTGAILLMADITGATLIFADLTGADLTIADLTGADLAYAGLTDANLIGADLSDASLLDTDLTGANLSGANLSGANLTGANLSGANLSDARHLEQEQLDSACISTDGKPPTLPEGLKPPQKVCGE